MKRYPLDVSIILVNYNTTKLLIQAIQSVYDKSSGFSFEIIVVDNNSIEDPRQPLLETFGNKYASVVNLSSFLAKYLSYLDEICSH